MKKRSSIILYVACAVICVAVIAFAVVFALGPDSAEEQATEQSSESVTDQELTDTTVADKDNIGFDIFD